MATLVSLVFTVGCAILMVTIFDIDSDGKMPYIIAFAVIAIWGGMYKWLKPKLDSNQSSNDQEDDIPARQS
ncbi:hypothetical protein JYT72_01750 [Crocinitomix catalasitica]|nr:hypothetical protein [Crocinitomix catalasitica]